MDLLFLGLVFLLMGVVSPTILSLGALALSLFLSLGLVNGFSSWFSFTLFLLYIGGMMVIIMYFSTLIPNQQFTMKIWRILFVGGLALLGLNMGGYLKGVYCFASYSVDSICLYEGGNLYISVFLLVFLFVLMLLVVVVTKGFGAPLRPLV